MLWPLQQVTDKITHYQVNSRHFRLQIHYRGADKSLARRGRKQASATKLLTFASHSKKIHKFSVQPGLRDSNDLCVDEEWRHFNYFFSRVGLRTYQHPCKYRALTFRHRASCILGQAFHYSPENAFYIFNKQIYFIIWYLLDRASLI